VISVGRLPAYVFTVYAGGRIADGRFLSGLAIILLIVLASVVGYYKQETVRGPRRPHRAATPFK